MGSSLSVHLPLTSDINKSQQHRNKLLGMMIIEPGAARREAKMLPVCYATPIFEAKVSCFKIAPKLYFKRRGKATFQRKSFISAT